MYDGDAIVLEFDGADVLQARYTHGEEVDQPLSMARGGVSYFYGVDHLGSVRLLTDASGAVANAYDYDAFGNLEETSFETVANPFGFTARERDAESGLMFYRARTYDPKLGRFISEDPIGFEGEDLNLYRYVYNNPVLLVDPKGQVSAAVYAATAVFAVAAVRDVLKQLAKGAMLTEVNFCFAAAAGIAATVTLANGGLGGAIAITMGLLTEVTGILMCVQKHLPPYPYKPGDDPGNPSA